ncbi:MAG: hypothetical protein ACFFDQ_02930 [Candidatus Thorarchaeota archaeon]
MSVLVSDTKRALFLVAWTIVLLVIPYSIYGTNGRFNISSILIDIWYDFSVGRLSIQYIPRVDYLLPSLLICTPCFLWLYKQRDMNMPMLFGSAGLVISVLTLILLLFLPLYAIFPWFPNPSIYFGMITIVPNFIDLIPYSGIVFTTMVLLPLLWRVLIYTKIQEVTLGKKVAGAVLSVSILLFPMTIETARWWSTDPNQNYIEEFSLHSATWSLNHRVDGNIWGQNAWFNFTMSPIFNNFIMILQISSAIIFAWFVCKGSVERTEIIQMFVAGLTHLLVVTLVCVWLSYTATYPGISTTLPFPILFIVGLSIFLINYRYQLRESKELMKNNETSVEELLIQLMAK